MTILCDSVVGTCSCGHLRLVAVHVYGKQTALSRGSPAGNDHLASLKSASRMTSVAVAACRFSHHKNMHLSSCDLSMALSTLRSQWPQTNDVWVGLTLDDDVYPEDLHCRAT